MSLMARLTVSLSILDSIRLAQDVDELPEWWLSRSSHVGLSRDGDGLVCMRGRLYVREIPLGLRQQILHDAHHSRFTVHPGSVKMYHDVC